MNDIILESWTLIFLDNNVSSGNILKQWRKDTSSVPSLTVDNRTVISAKEKASVLNDQFQSVFTLEDLTTILEIGTENFHPMQLIQFSESGIQILLQNLKANKSPGPNRIHPLVLKHCSHELAPILKVIFTQSLNTGSIPSDWLMANISPVYKKGNKDLPVNYYPIIISKICLFQGYGTWHLPFYNESLK